MRQLCFNPWHLSKNLRNTNTCFIYFSRKIITRHNEFCQAVHSLMPKLFSYFMIIFEFYFHTFSGKQFFSRKCTNHSQSFSRFVFFDKQFAASRHVLYYLPSNVCLPQMFLSIFTVHFYRSCFLFRVMSYYTCLIIFYFAWLLHNKIHFFAILFILVT